MVSTNISPENLESYTNADYYVYSDPKFILKIGEKSLNLIDLYQKFNKSRASFLTAYNQKQKKQVSLKGNRFQFDNYPYNQLRRLFLCQQNEP